MNVVVYRGGQGCKIEVPIAALANFRSDQRTGGRNERFTYPRLSAVMSCAEIPEGGRETFGHSCQHGPPPHLIRVLVDLDGRPRHRAKDVARLAWEANRLAAAARQGLVTTDAS